jgi:hypothetical protein
MIHKALDSKYTWFYSYWGERLHFIPQADDFDGFWTDAVENGFREATAACGTRAKWSAPGIFSRMGMPRCQRCCVATGIPQGDGTPFNFRDAILAQMRATHRS